MQLCMHIGLHKTGSTSFQVSAFNAAPKLAEHGIVYPTSGAFVEGCQHLKLAAMLKRSEFSQVLEEFQRLTREHADARYLVMSSEELSSVLADMDDAASMRFSSSLSSMFSRVSYFCVARPEGEILRSGIREYVEGVGFPYDGYGFVSTCVNDFFRRVCNLQSRLPNLYWVDFGKIKGERLASRLLEKMTSLDVDFDTVTTNRTAEKTLIGSLLLSQLRLLHFNMSEDEHVYTERIRAECETFLGEIPIAEALDRKLEARFARWLDDTLAKVVDERTRAGAVTRAFRFSSRGVRWSTATQPDDAKAADGEERALSRDVRAREYGDVVEASAKEEEGTSVRPGEPGGALDPKLIGLLICPVTRMPLEWDATTQELISPATRLAYPVRDGIPILLKEHARKLD